MDDCCPVQVELSGGDRDLARRIQGQVWDKIGAARPRPPVKLGRTLLLAAALTLLLGTMAYAISGFFMNAEQRDPAGPAVHGRWLMLSESGEVLTDRKEAADNAGLVLSFSGPEAGGMKPEFRCFYLPSEPSYGWTDEEGWTFYLTDEHGEEEGSLPYIICAGNVEPGVVRYTISGDTRIVKESQWGDWQVLEISADTSGIPYMGYREANYVLLFDQSRGWLVRVTGTLDLETLEHIARELEIRESDTPFEPSGYSELLSSLDPARG